MAEKTKKGAWHPKMGERYEVARMRGVRRNGKACRRKWIGVEIGSVNSAERTVTVHLLPDACDELGFLNLTGTVGWGQLRKPALGGSELSSEPPMTGMGADGPPPEIEGAP